MRKKPVKTDEKNLENINTSLKINHFFTHFCKNKIYFTGPCIPGHFVGLRLSTLFPYAADGNHKGWFLCYRSVFCRDLRLCSNSWERQRLFLWFHGSCTHGSFTLQGAAKGLQRDRRAFLLCRVIIITDFRCDRLSSFLEHALSLVHDIHKPS